MVEEEVRRSHQPASRHFRMRIAYLEELLDGADPQGKIEGASCMLLERIQKENDIKKLNM